jgi:hypothetical protein
MRFLNTVVVPLLVVGVAARSEIRRRDDGTVADAGRIWATNGTDAISGGNGTGAVGEVGNQGDVNGAENVENSDSADNSESTNNADNADAAENAENADAADKGGVSTFPRLPKYRAHKWYSQVAAEIKVVEEDLEEGEG